jgi:uncharacterized lipoprotein YmbA
LYLLAPIDADTAAVTSQAGGDFSVGIGPLDLPEYLNRPQIVTRIQDNRIQTADFANWAEPLSRNFQGVLAENLARMLGSNTVYRHPWRSSLRPTYRLLLEVIRFDANPKGDAVLAVRWELLDAHGEQLIRRQKAVYRQPVAQDDYGAVATAMSRVLADFSREVAVRIAALH